MNQEKYIETPELIIKENIMKWQGMIIQLSNVSCISMSSLVLLAFPKLAIGIFLLGLVVYEMFSPIVGVAMIGGSIAWLVIWYLKNEERKNTKNLNIMLNSGTSLCIQIKDLEFLKRVLNVLEEIIIKGGVEGNKILINISDSSIGGDLKMLNDVKLK